MLGPLLRVQESLLIRDGERPSTPPTFIIGAPRAGTTLAYQLLTDQIRTSYICNFAASFPAFPVAATWLVRREIRKYRSDFTSKYGRTKHRAGPCEGYVIWQRWFKWNGNSEAQILPEDVVRARATVAALERVLGAPFINKDPHHSGRIHALHRAFPNCLFIWVRRNPIAAAQSLLKARRLSPRELTDAPREQVWWGHRPREYQCIKTKHYVDQVCEQIYLTERNIADDLNIIGAKRRLEIWYEDLCSDTNAQLYRIASFLSERTVHVEATGHRLPELNKTQRSLTSPTELRIMRIKLESLYGTLMEQPDLAERGRPIA
ncbi:MAG: sulfotransferase family protein [Planctomycetota bacterium]|jgi:hypothetical protein